MVATATRKARAARVETPAELPVSQVEAPTTALTFDGATRGKFLLFAVPRAEKVQDGPVMRGFVETNEGRIDVAGWTNTARDTGVEYLSLKFGNTRKPEADATPGEEVEYVLGPFYGRLFRETTTDSITGHTVTKRYFGYVGKSEKTGVDEHEQAVYQDVWELSLKAKPALSGDQSTRYINGTVNPKQRSQDETQTDGLPF